MDSGLVPGIGSFSTFSQSLQRAAKAVTHGGGPRAPFPYFNLQTGALISALAAGNNSRRIR